MMISLPLTTQKLNFQQLFAHKSTFLNLNIWCHTKIDEHSNSFVFQCPFNPQEHLILSEWPTGEVMKTFEEVAKEHLFSCCK